MDPQLIQMLMQMYRQQAQQKRDAYKQYAQPQNIPQPQAGGALPRNNPFKRFGGF